MNYTHFFFKNKFYLLSSIFLFTIVLHYIPFERSALSPDDYSLLEKEYKGFFNFIDGPSDRPLHYLFADIQNILISDNALLGFLLNLVSNFILIYVTYLFLNCFIKDKYTIFLVLVINCLIFQKIEIFQTPIFAIPVLAYSIYLLCIIFFIYYSENNNKLFLIYSSIFYFLAVFFYEPGFFTPFILFIYIIIYKKNKLINYFPSFFIFFIISLFYYVYRETSAFGYSEMQISRNINPNNFFNGSIDVFHNVIGRTSIRIFLYGLFQFFNINYIILIPIIILNLIIIYSLFLFYSAKNIYKINNQFILFSFSLCIVFIIPNVLIGAMGGRHLIIPSIFISILIIYILSKIKFSKYIFLFFLFISIFINQGNSWSQVVASRINAEIYKIIEEDKNNEFSNSQIIIFNRGSFAKNIDYELIDNKINLLHTYFGAQAIEDHGIVGMINFKYKFNKKQIYFVADDPSITIGSKYKLKIFKTKGYRNISEKYIIKNFDGKNVLILDYKKVFPNSHEKILFSSYYSNK